ncbi:hypothetical protein FRB93_010269 [Tulasnella sp. JGI-2019a]|nr:hypothetical protein FRB93_010269 [Tulasnella sp. JGI-2019a]
MRSIRAVPATNAAGSTTKQRITAAMAKIQDEEEQTRVTAIGSSVHPVVGPFGLFNLLARPSEAHGHVRRETSKLAGGSNSKTFGTVNLVADLSLWRIEGR